MFLFFFGVLFVLFCFACVFFLRPDHRVPSMDHTDPSILFTARIYRFYVSVRGLTASIFEMSCSRRVKKKRGEDTSDVPRSFYLVTDVDFCGCLSFVCVWGFGLFPPVFGR